MLLKQFVLTFFAFSFAVALWSGADNAYDAWHKTQLERWLDDHDVPYLKPSSRTDLVRIVKENWQKATSSTPTYHFWDISKLQQWLTSRNLPYSPNQQQKALVKSVKNYWYDAEDQWQDSKNWVFNTWADSQLKSFLEKNGVSKSNFESREELMATVHETYNKLSQKSSKSPSEWIFDTWSDSELKSWADSRGLPVPQGSKRNELIAILRKNFRNYSLHAHDFAARIPNYVRDGAASAASACSSIGKNAMSSISEAASNLASSAAKYAFETWSESELKAFADKNGIPVPQGSTKNQVIAILRKHANAITDVPIQSKLSDSATSILGAATSKAGDIYGKATDLASEKAQDALELAMSSWSDSDIKAFLDSHGVPVPQNSKRDELKAFARRNAHYYMQSSDFHGSDMFSQLQGYMRIFLKYLRDLIAMASGAAYQKVQDTGRYADEKASVIKHRADEMAQSATNYVKGEL